MVNELQASILTTIMPTLSVRNGAAAIDYYEKAFGAQELMRVSSPDGEIVAELAIDNAHFFIADEAPAYGNCSPQTLKGTSIRMGLQVADPDSMAQQAIAAGGKEIQPVADQEYGYRLGRIEDPFGHHWEIFRPL